MGLIAGVQCDICGAASAWEWNAGKKYVRKWARKEGWKIGKLCKCPECAKQHGKKRDGENT